jgi:hypothetical protein
MSCTAECSAKSCKFGARRTRLDACKDLRSLVQAFTCLFVLSCPHVALCKPVQHVLQLQIGSVTNIMLCTNALTTVGTQRSDHGANTNVCKGKSDGCVKPTMVRKNYAPQLVLCEALAESAPLQQL